MYCNHTAAHWGLPYIKSCHIPVHALLYFDFEYVDCLNVLKAPQYNYAYVCICTSFNEDSCNALYMIYKKL